jgi:hypothetical protein
MSTDHASIPANDSIMTVLTNQRDRLKKQNQGLEGVILLTSIHFYRK